ncbi:peptide chain release factor 1 [Galactobacter caseinivorans]|uniref:Peptide chain release factor 1 n=1 Tax=Galactobacter caseinivorans TaxID=2676123 RepID=A0A496PMZ7_9MICC|nr:peptide chain release factor 1 [Galactobacter caseinivorans]RKW71849.1 peptide chain release factor 1 [Galactobacter caseinivorans]
MFESVQTLVDEYAQIQGRLADPAVYQDQGLARKLGRRGAELSSIVETYRRWQQAQEDLEASSEMAELDPEFAAEAEELKVAIPVIAEKLRRLLIPRDPNDGRDAILEVKGGEGGAEAALFAGDLLRMYIRYAESRGWKTELISANESDLGGYKDAQIAIKGKGNDPAQGVYAALKYEGGVHRVQRVPVTESQGRIHTSAAAVLVFPEVDEPEEIEIQQNDLKIDVYRSSGPGGQSVNTTDSAVRITHLPTGIVVAMQNEKSQLQNRDAAMRVLRSRLLAYQQEQIDAENSDARHSQVRSMDRSERIRTYNFPENRIADHRTGYKAYNLDAVINGDIQPLIDSCISVDEESRLAALGEGED